MSSASPAQQSGQFKQRISATEDVWDYFCRVDSGRWKCRADVRHRECISMRLPYQCAVFIKLRSLLVPLVASLLLLTTGKSIMFISTCINFHNFQLSLISPPLARNHNHKLVSNIFLFNVSIGYAYPHSQGCISSFSLVCTDQ